MPTSGEAPPVTEPASHRRRARRVARRERGERAPVCGHPPPSARAAALAAGFVALLLAGWGAGELWLSIVGSGELDPVRELAAQRTAALTGIARGVTWAGSAFVLVPLAVIGGLALFRAGPRRETLAIALSLGGAMLLSDLVKLLVSRPRPPVEHLQAVTGWSFPSAHATQASAFWLSLLLALRATRPPRIATRVAGALAPVLIVAVAASRVYLGVHYPSDVVAGMLLGAGWAACVWHFVGKAG
jgi:membrane-associated phospholipid phosphatase